MDIWMKSEIPGTFQGERLLAGRLHSGSDAQRIALALNEEFADMGLPVRAWTEG